MNLLPPREKKRKNLPIKVIIFQAPPLYSMAPNLDSPVQTQMAIAVLNRTLSSEYPANKKSNTKPGGRRPLFVQNDCGCVLGIESDRGNNAHTVKRKLQISINVPTEESSLAFGDRVLKDDLSCIRNDSPLLHRSSSSPCLSPAGRELWQRDRSGPIEILGCSSRCFETKQLVKDVAKAIKSGVEPLAVHSGLGGAYYFRNSRGQSIAIVKPMDEEPFAPNNPKGFVGKALGQPGLKRSVRVGETGFREVAAYLLDYDHFANVPPTVLVRITHSVFHVNDGVDCANGKAYDRKSQAVSKIASFQHFIPHDFDASDHGTSNFPVAAVHRIGILDIRIFNTDRHAGNILVRRLVDGTGRFGAQTELIPIDHGLCLPESLEDPYFEWIHWPQASVPFSEDELEYIANLDPVRDSDMLRMELPMIHDSCLRVLVLSTIFLKEAAAFGLCLAEIGEMMSREFRGMEEEPSELEVVCIEARRLVVAERDVFPLEAAELVDEDVVQFDIDCEDAEPLMPRTPLSYRLGSKGGGRSRNPLSKLEEGLEEKGHADHEKRIVEEFAGFPPDCNRFPNISKLSVSSRGRSLTQRYPGGVLKGNNTAVRTNNSGVGCGLQSGRGSANTQLPASMSFVKLADMGEEEWGLFLEKFQQLLCGAFRGRKSVTALRQRLGTSCQF